jgi:hypothetical protein
MYAQLKGSSIHHPMSTASFYSYTVIFKVMHQGENIVRLEVATGNCAFQLDTFSPSLLEQLYFRGD